jgi:hypothetical protein
MPRRKHRRVDLVGALARLPVAAMQALTTAAARPTFHPVAVDATPEQRFALAVAALTVHSHGHTLLESCAVVARESGFDLHPALLRSWCRESDRLGRMLRRARELCAEALAESTLVIADEGSCLERDRLRIDARMGMARKLDPVRWAQ